METETRSPLRSWHYGASLLLCLALVPVLRSQHLPLKADWITLGVAYWIVLAAQSIFAAALLAMIGMPREQILAPLLARYRENPVRIVFVLAYLGILVWAAGAAKALVLTVDAIVLLELRDRRKMQRLGRAASAILAPAAYLFFGFLMVLAYNNLIVSANLNVEAHCRVMLTTPIETFSIGHTIVISRGLIDVLPDEASLAMVLADELSHIALGHRTQTQFAFNNQTMLSDAELLQKFHFQRTADEMTSAGQKTIEIMKASPYQKMANAGLFLKELASRGSTLPRLLQANLGNQFANADAVNRLAAFAASAPALEENKIEQIAALPLGSRVKVNPWDNQVVLVKTRPISLLSAREKMPFEITPFSLYLTRIAPAAPETARK